MKQSRIVLIVKKFTERWKKNGIFPLLSLVSLFLGIAMLGGLTPDRSNQNRASNFPFPAFLGSQSVTERFNLQKNSNQKITQSAFIAEGTAVMIPADTMLFLEDRQFTCQQMPDLVELQHWECTKSVDETEVEVGIFMKSMVTVHLLDANVRQGGVPSDEVTMTLLSMFADLPGIRVDREESLAWVSEAVKTVGLHGGIQTKTIQGVIYRIYGSKEDCSLEIEIP